MNLRYLDPEGLAHVGNLELVARRVVEGFLSGRHRSPYHGFSAEYLDHRAYVPGDEIRALDWKIHARTDKYFVKQYEDETNLRAHILLDCSASMGFGSERLSKLAYGSYLTAALTYLMLRQNDAVGLVTFDDQVREFLPPRARPTQFRRVLETLDDTDAQHETNVAAILHEVADRIRRRGLIILISDLIDEPADIAAGLQHFRHNQHEVIVFHVMDHAELTFPYEGITRFRDPEGAGRVTASPRRVRQRYLERLEAFTEQVRRECFGRSISYTLADTAQPYDRCLAAYLDKRTKLG